MKSGDLIIGVDGGGSRTRATLAKMTSSSDPDVLGRGESGPGNIRAIGEQKAFANIENAVEAAFHAAGLQRVQTAAACVGLAGADRSNEKNKVQQWADRFGLAEKTVAVNDALPVLYTAHEQGVGIAIISGTGAIALGRDKNGNTARCGGWGYRFGDEGSGYWIAIEGLRAAAQFADGRGPETILLEKLMRLLDLSSPSDLITRIYSDKTDRSQIAGLAKVVFEAVQEDDLVARRVMERAASELATLVKPLLGKLELPSPVTLAFAGTVLLQPVLQSLIHDQLAALKEYNLEYIPVADSTLGALRLASSS